MSNGPHILIVESPYYKDIAEYLASGAIAALEKAGASFERIEVPGALEIPSAIKLSSKVSKYDGYVALGCVIRGETSHYDIVAIESARALMDMTVNHELPIGNGILTCDTKDQAVTRADPAQKNKGADAVAAALSLIEIKNKGTA